VDLLASMPLLLSQNTTTDLQLILRSTVGAGAGAAGIAWSASSKAEQTRVLVLASTVSMLLAGRAKIPEAHAALCCYVSCHVLLWAQALHCWCF
jgi:hypothetical protein